MHASADGSGRYLELKVRAAGGDSEALELLIASLYGPVERFLARRISSPYLRSHIEDMAQEALWRTARSIRDVRARTDRELLSWVMSIARNVLLEQVRRRLISPHAQFVDEVQLGQSQDGTLESQGDDAGSIELLLHLLEASYMAQSVDTQRLLWMRLIMGAKWAEVASEIGTTPAGAKRRFQRAQQRLRKDVERQVGILDAGEREPLIRWLERLGLSDSAVSLETEEEQ